MSEPTSHDPLPLPPESTAASLPLAQPVPADSANPVSVPVQSDRTVISQAPIAGPGEFYATGTVASLARVLIGQSLDHYLLHELIGGGGMGAVFRASDTRLDREVAVKVIPNLGRDLETMRRFRVEAQSAAKLDHPHIARVYHVGDTEAWSYIVFEYVEGVNLRDLVIREGPLSIDDAVCLTVQVAEALQHASERSVVHRDIKPSNVLVNPDGVVKVVDMGLARTTTLEQNTRDLTASGVTLGTFDYISPEQARDPRLADVRSDLYSLGCTLYFILTGRPPFADGTAFQKLLMHSSAEPEDPSAYRDDLSPDLVAIIRKLMAKRPGDRYQTPADLIADLAFFADAQNLPHARDLSGVLAAPSVTSRSLFDASMPWLVGLMLIFASTWYLYFQHRVGLAFEIPREIKVSDDVSIDEGLENSGLSESKLGKESLPTSIFAGDGIMRSSGPTTERESPIAETKLGNFETTGSTTTRIDGREPPERPATVVSKARVLLVQPFVNRETRLTPLDSEEHRLFSGTLIEAVAEAERDPLIEEIWLDDDVWVVDKPLTIKRSSLILKSAPVRRARIEWRLTRTPLRTSSDAQSEPVVAAVRVASNHLILDDLELAIYPPTSGSGKYRFIEVDAGGTTHLLHSTVTMMPSGSAWQVACFGAETDRTASSESSDDGVIDERDPLQIRLEDCVVRGEGDFAAFEIAKRVEIAWQNGLLAVSGRMVSLAGASETSRPPPTVRLDLEDLTLATKSGFARIKPKESADRPVFLSRVARNCVFWTESDSPLISIENANSTSEWTETQVGEWLDLRGVDNAYDPGIVDLVRVRTDDGERREFGFSDVSNSFFTDRAPETYVRWVNKLPSATPWEQQTAGDYLQRDGSFRPGFRPEELPNH